MFNVTRTQPAPHSLSRKISYRDEDVVSALKEIFFDKCYLCETKDPTSLNVEHLIAHEGDIDKKFDWNNLYYCCGRCNNIKLANYSDLLDCADKNVNVFVLIKHLPPHSPNQNRLVITAMAQDQKTINTARLLDDIFNSERTVNKKITGAYLRKNVFKKYNRFLDLVNQYFDDELTQGAKDEALSRLRVLMSRKQEYSAFIRWVVKEDATLDALLAQHID